MTRRSDLGGAILSAALELFDRESPPSIRQIAERAGVGVGSVYDHFRNRAGLLDAIVDREAVQVREDLLEVLESVDDAPLEAALEAFGVATLDRYIGRGPLMRASIRGLLKSGRVSQLVGLRDAFLPVLVGRILRDIPALEPHRDEVEHSVLAVADMTVGLALTEVHRDVDAARQARHQAAVRRLVRSELAYLRSLPQA